MKQGKPDSNAPPENLVRLQRQFADHIRNPDSVAQPEGIEPRRMAIYRRLFFANIRNLMARNFPVIRRLLDDQAFDRLIREFMIEHRPSTPLFPEIGRELVRYLADSACDHDHRPPFLAELADWEFIETCVRLDAREINPDQATDKPDLLKRRPRINPTLRLNQSQWPVHRIGPRFLPTEPSPVLLAAWRKADDKVAFMTINAVTAKLLLLLQENPAMTGLDALNVIAGELEAVDPDSVIRAGTELLERLRQRQVLVGSA